MKIEYDRTRQRGVGTLMYVGDDGLPTTSVKSRVSVRKVAIGVGVAFGAMWLLELIGDHAAKRRR